VIDRTPEQTELVRLAQRGDVAAFTRLHERHARVVHAVLLARLPAEEARELVQDAFLQAWQRLPDLRDPLAFGAWLMQIARNLATDSHRRRRPEVELPAELAAPEVPHLEAGYVLAAIRSLPEAYRETLLMRLVEGMTGPEIAERTGLTHGSVRVNLNRGMKLLKERLGVHHE
jgi:RNA polymerase sigma-70 factor (ECF subfamily)